MSVFFLFEEGAAKRKEIIHIFKGLRALLIWMLTCFKDVFGLSKKCGFATFPKIKPK